MNISDAVGLPGHPGAMSDEQLVISVRTGETALFEELMRRCNQRAYRVARAIVKNDTEAEDVMFNLQMTDTEMSDLTEYLKSL